MEALQTQNPQHIQQNLHHLQMGHLTQKERQEAAHRVEGIASQQSASKSYVDVPDTRENREKIREAMQNYQAAAKSEPLRHQIRMHSKSGKLQVALVNIKTGETVEEIPSSKLIEFRSELSKMGGLFVEEKA